MKNNNYGRNVFVFVDALPLVLSTFISVLGLFALVLLLADSFNNPLGWAMGLLLASASGIYVYHVIRDEHLELKSERNIANTLVVFGVILWGIFNVAYVSQHVFVNRDPAIYAVAGEWLVEHESLDIPRAEFLEEGDSNIVSSSDGFENNPANDTSLNVQGLHLFPALLGSAGKVLGSDAVFYLNILFGMTAILSLYAFTKNISRPYWALVISSALAVSMPLVYFSRATYTEPLTLAFIFSGLALLWAAQKKATDLGLWLLSGVVLGSATVTRVDGYFIWIVVIALVATLIATASTKKYSQVIKTATVLVAGAAIPSIIGWLDLTLLSPSYYQNIRSQFVYIFILLFILIVAAVLATTVSIKVKMPKKINIAINSSWLQNTLFIGVFAFFIIMLARPFMYNELLPDLSRQIAGLLTSARLSVEEMGARYTAYQIFWYLGPILAVSGIAGLAYAVRKVAKRGIEKETVLFSILIFVLFMVAIYYIRPSIYGDQIWASRRQLTVILPAIASFGALGLTVFQKNYISKLNATVRRATVLLLTAALLIIPFRVSQPLVFAADTARLNTVQEICETLPENAAVLWIGRAGLHLTMTTRTYCDVPTATMKGLTLSSGDVPVASSELLSSFASSAAMNGYEPIVGVYKFQTDSVEGLESAIVGNVDSKSIVRVIDAGFVRLNRTVTEPPKDFAQENVTIYLFSLNDKGTIKFYEE